MGLKEKTSRCSERLITRHLTLRLGYTPAPELVATQRKLFSTPRHTLTASSRTPNQSDIYNDINLNRSESSEFNFNTPQLHNTQRMAEETRIVDIETDVTSLKTDVGTLKNDVASISDKMDTLIQAMGRLGSNQPTPTAPASAPVPETSSENQATGVNQNITQQSNHPLSGQNQISQHNLQACNQSHRLIVVSNQCNNISQPSMPMSNQTSNSVPRQQMQQGQRNLSSEEFIQREMDQDKFAYPEAGKNTFANDVIPSRLMSKPYMFIYRDGVSTMKQKLDARQSITSTEYNDASLSLLSDLRAFHPNNFNDIPSLTQCHSRRPGVPVAGCKEVDTMHMGLGGDGAMSWADRDIIHEERVRMCLTSAYNHNVVNHSNRYEIPARRHQGMQEVTCRQFNTRNGCPHKESHAEGQVYSLHICTYCDSVGRTCYHSVRECERQLSHTRNDNGPNGRNRNASNNHHQFNAGHQHQNYNTYAPQKNGYWVPQGM